MSHAADAVEVAIPVAAAATFEGRQEALKKRSGPSFYCLFFTWNTMEPFLVYEIAFLAFLCLFMLLIFLTSCFSCLICFTIV